MLLTKAGKGYIFTSMTTCSGYKNKTNNCRSIRTIHSSLKFKHTKNHPQKWQGDLNLARCSKHRHIVLLARGKIIKLAPCKPAIPLNRFCANKACRKLSCKDIMAQIDTLRKMTAYGSLLASVLWKTKQLNQRNV